VIKVPFDLGTFADESVRPSTGNQSSYWFVPHVDIEIGGRPLLNVWRLMRHEVALQSYTQQNLVYHLLNRRIPEYSDETLYARLTSSSLSLVFA